MITIGTINFSDKKGMYNALKGEISTDNHLQDFMIFDDETYTVWLIWWDK